MPFQADPYRTLGLAPGASLNEIRSAYRRLAKRYHPDAAGDRALPRFLAIQAAYERLVDGDGRLRQPGHGTAQADGRGSSGRGSAREPWRADAARARASREAWRTRRSGGAGTAGRARPEDGAGPGGRRAADEPHHRRPTRRATPGSTSYDEAAEAPLDPAWDGGAWYGPSSGTYWTINPREYADPRKHGPEYLARAIRAAGSAEAADDDGPSKPVGGEPTGFGAAAPSPSTGPDRSAGHVRHPPARPTIGSIVRRFGPRSLLSHARRTRSR